MTTANTTGATTTRSPEDALEILREHILVDGYPMIMDPQLSRGPYLHDQVTGHDYLDFYAFFASQPITYNHPRMQEPEFQSRLLAASMTKVANADVYTQYYADFVETLARVAAPEGFAERMFFIDGGALAVENALKAAFDWKVRKNLAAGRGELGSQVIHFTRAFHGRTGYTLSLTNTADPTKTKYFPKFDWPRIESPAIAWDVPEPRRNEDAANREQAARAAIDAAIQQNPHDIAGIIVEPIQGEGGDNHFRPEFFQMLREVCDQHELLLIFDEVQTGVGMTGKMWAYQHFGVSPDLICFGKKMQVCGIFGGPRLDEVDSVFKIPSRINSTWGGNLTDMVRAAHYLRIIEEEDLVARAAETGEYLLERLRELQQKHASVSAARGRGLMCAFDLPSPDARDKLRNLCFERGMMVLGCGVRTARFRPVLDIAREDLDKGLEILDDALTALEQTAD